MMEKPYHLCFETLSNDLRLKILEQLEKKPMSVEELARAVNAERSRVSHSLKMLKTCSYVDVERKGKERIYSVKEGSFGCREAKKNENTIFQVINNHIEHQCHNVCKKMKNEEIAAR